MANKPKEQDKNFDVAEFIILFIQENPFMAGFMVAGACIGAMIDKKLKGGNHE